MSAVLACVCVHVRRLMKLRDLCNLGIGWNLGFMQQEFPLDLHVSDAAAVAAVAAAAEASTADTAGAAADAAKMQQQQQQQQQE